MVMTTTSLKTYRSTPRSCSVNGHVRKLFPLHGPYLYPHTHTHRAAPYFVVAWRRDLPPARCLIPSLPPASSCACVLCVSPLCFADAPPAWGRADGDTGAGCWSSSLEAPAARVSSPPVVVVVVGASDRAAFRSAFFEPNLDGAQNDRCSACAAREFASRVSCRSRARARRSQPACFGTMARSVSATTMIKCSMPHAQPTAACKFGWLGNCACGSAALASGAPAGVSSWNLVARHNPTSRTKTAGTQVHRYTHTTRVSRAFADSCSQLHVQPRQEVGDVCGGHGEQQAVGDDRQPHLVHATSHGELNTDGAHGVWRGSTPLRTTPVNTACHVPNEAARRGVGR